MDAHSFLYVCFISGGTYYIFSCCLLLGSKRKTTENASATEGVHIIDVSASSSTPSESASVIGGSGTQAQGQDHPAPGVVEIDDDETGTQVSGKRQKRCTSMV